MMAAALLLSIAVVVAAFLVLVFVGDVLGAPRPRPREQPREAADWLRPDRMVTRPLRAVVRTATPDAR
ncbi:MAG TPA: hypothetical protein VHE35_18085 [Kofleriaceae bacterium]|nr:hypothetical protein [Kofleriaceae bacterium]